MVKSVLPIKKPAHIPVQKFLKNSKLKEVLTEDLEQILNLGPLKMTSDGLMRMGQKRKFQEVDDSKPPVVVAETDFMKMMSLQVNVIDGQVINNKLQNIITMF